MLEDNKRSFIMADKIIIDHENHKLSYPRQFSLLYR